MRSFVDLFFFFSLISFASAQSIAAWHNGYGSQVILQNATTGDVYYSDCNSYGDTPSFATDPLNVFEFQRKPKVGSAFTATGYASGDVIYAQIWYTDSSNTIWQVRAQCSTASSTYTVTGTYEVSVNITTPISSTTGLTALLLSSQSGYRVFFHNSTGHVHQLVYTSKKGWTDSIPISPDVPEGQSLSSIVSGTSNLTIIYPFTDQAIEVAEYNTDKTFHDSSFPYPLSNTSATSASTTASSVDSSSSVGDNALPNFVAANVTLGVTLDSGSDTRRIFYIDSTGQLQYYSCDLAANINCSLQDTQSSTYWADGTVNGGLGVAYQDSTSELFYLSSDEKLVMAKLVDSSWSELSTLTSAVSSWTVNGTTSSSSSSSSSDSSSSSGSSSNSSSDSSDGGETASSTLSGGAKAGIAIGVIGGVALIAVGAFFFWRRKKATPAVPPSTAQSWTDKTQLGSGKPELDGLSSKNPCSSSTTPWGSPSPTYGSPVPTAHEVPDTARLEMDAISRPQEIHGQSMPMREMDGRPLPRYELA